jgi:prepilin-type processing-associated H-X9-DG protein
MWDTFGGSGNQDAAGNPIGVFNHVPGGCNVMYLDGHVAYVRYPGQFPITNDDQVVKENSHHGQG